MTEVPTDIASAMLAAITTEYTETGIAAPSQVKTKEQVDYLMKNIKSLSQRDRKAVGDILVLNGKKNMLTPCASGIVINLDVIAQKYPYIVDQMYELMLHRLSL